MKGVPAQQIIDAIVRYTNEIDKRGDILYAAPAKGFAMAAVFVVRFEDGHEATYWLRAGLPVLQ